MFLVVGLGNPGPRYAGSRHNVGFWCVDRLSKTHGIAVKSRGRLYATGVGRIDGREVALAKPRTFVNESGRAVAALVHRHGVTPSELLVIYDDIDLPLGRLRLRPSGSHGGHNGMKSIIEALGTTGFARLRIGVGRPHVAGEPTWEREHVAGHVLARLSADDRRTLEAAADRAAEAVAALIVEGLETAMNRYNR